MTDSTSILDLENKEPQESKSIIFSKLSFFCAILSIISFAYEIHIFLTQAFLDAKVEGIWYFGYVRAALLVLGLVFVFLSFYKNEPSKFLKSIGAVVNILFLLLLIVAFFVFS